jgi:hypothetical protein
MDLDRLWSLRPTVHKLHYPISCFWYWDTFYNRCFPFYSSNRSTQKNGRPIESQYWRKHSNGNMGAWKANIRKTIHILRDDFQTRFNKVTPPQTTMLRWERKTFQWVMSKTGHGLVGHPNVMKNVPVLQHLCWGHRRSCPEIILRTWYSWSVNTQTY